MKAVSTPLQLLADLAMIINFAVESDGGIAVIGDHGLSAAGEVDNLQADRAQARRAAIEAALLIRSTMHHRGCNPRANLLVAAPSKPGKSCDSAHKLLL